jgi:IS1 family transposase
LAKKKSEKQNFVDTLEPAKPDDILELDELWSFVLNKDNKQWLWLALCRRSKQIVGYFIGKRDKSSCLGLWHKIPEEYRKCKSFSDFWESYSQVFSPENHTCVGKDSGQTAHIERFNNTIRQRLARYVRKTLSFSKSEYWHNIVTDLFIKNYNLSVLT